MFLFFEEENQPVSVEKAIVYVWLGKGDQAFFGEMATNLVRWVYDLGSDGLGSMTVFSLRGISWLPIRFTARERKGALSVAPWHSLTLFRGFLQRFRFPFAFNEQSEISDEGGQDRHE